MKLFRHDLGALNEIARLGFEKPGRTNKGLQLGRASFCIVTWPLVSTKEIRGDLVDALVGALRRQDGGHEQFPRGSMGEFDPSLRHRGLKRLRNALQSHPVRSRRCWRTSHVLLADSEEVTTEMQAQPLGRPGWLLEGMPPRRVHGRDGPGAGARCRDAARIRRWPDSDDKAGLPRPAEFYRIY